MNISILILIFGIISILLITVFCIKLIVDMIKSLKINNISEDAEYDDSEGEK